METKKIVILSAAFLMTTGLVFGGLVMLRNRGISEDVPIGTQVSTNSQSNQNKVPLKKNETLTKEELELRQRNSDLGKTMPADITQTWSPEYKAQMIKMTGIKQQINP